MATTTPDDQKYESVVKNHPYFIYDTKREIEVTAGKFVACGTREQLEKIIDDHLKGDHVRYEIRRNG